MSGRACAVVAWGASSALGEGESAFACAAPGERAPTRVMRDDELAAAGLVRPYCGRVPMEAPAGRDRATVLLERALDACARQLDDALPGWWEKRVGLAIGTSSGGMRTFERTPADQGLPIEGTYLGPVLAAARPMIFEPFAHVLGACASSTIAIGLARAWLLEDACDVALCGGYDALGPFVASGFEVLRATSATPGPRPFRTQRDGLALGEGAAVLALVRQRERARAWVTGFGASCDATHLTAPDRTGGGLARAARQALDDASAAPGSIDLVSAHGTATSFNDAAESLAIEAVLGGEAKRPVVHAFKGTVGHTLGAAGALETLAAIDAMTRGLAPASHGEGPIERDLRVLDVSERGDLRTSLKLASAFGGANAALVLTREAPPASPRAPSDVHVSRAVHVDGARVPDAKALAERTGYPEDRIARGDELVRLTIAAVAALEDRVGPLKGAGIVVGHGLATLETNATYLARMRTAGAARAEPRRFPYTTPNASAGEAAIAFGLTGPAFAVGGGPHGGIEAIASAAALVRAGVAERIVVVAADEAGPASERTAPGTRSGAVAVLVAREPLAARLVEAKVHLDPAPVAPSARPSAPMHAHAALVPLAGERRPDVLEAALPWGGFAIARLFWL